jgi:hypothetical protein
MTLRCDHCRQELGLSAQHYWRMRFCSQACKHAYQRRLDQSTRDKIGLLDCVAPHAPQAMGRPLASRSRAEFSRGFAA